MPEREPSSFPLQTAGTDIERPTEAFAVLSNETRLEILLALWEAYDPGRPDEPVSFSALRDRVGTEDSGQFNYHLDKLAGWFVRRTDEGYTLRQAGQKVVRTVIAGAGIQEPTLERTEIDVACPLCGAATAVLYADEWLYHVCTECEGAYEGHEEQPEGYLTGMSLDPAGFADREAEGLWMAAWTRTHGNLRSMVEGVCDACSGVAERTLGVCDDHDPDGVCGTCHRRSRVLAYLGCRVCKNFHVTTPGTLAVHHPAVVAFYHEHGVPTQYAVEDLAAVRRRNRLVAEHEQHLLASDPPRVRVEVRHQGDGLDLTMDEGLQVVDVERDP